MCTSKYIEQQKTSRPRAVVITITYLVDNFIGLDKVIAWVGG